MSGPETWARDEFMDEGADGEGEAGVYDGSDEFVICCTDPECVMPGPHFRSECHTAEMIEATNAEIAGDADTTSAQR